MNTGSDTPFAALLADVGARARERAAHLAMAALEHLLRQQSWARERLRVHAGRSILIVLDATPPGGLPRPELLATVDAQGLLKQADADAVPAVTLHIRPSVDAVFEMLREGPQSATRHVRIEGDAAFATTLGELARQLRWDAEEDLSRITGDVAARRIGRFVEGGASRLRDAGERARSAAERYVADDQRMLATRPLARELAAAVRALDERVATVEKSASALRTRR